MFEAAGEPWESDVTKLALKKENTLFFVAYIDGRPVGMTRAHTNDGVCRIDYLLVATKHRRKGVGRAIIRSFTAYCKENKIENCFLWPDGESAERIYHEAGFRLIEVKTADRAVYKR
ncbi:MAG: GNAT family N-acetyltransferase [Clostridiales bacterium]|nr:GNAT family N-acetyltransferase [Clostridiales bacterium]